MKNTHSHLLVDVNFVFHPLQRPPWHFDRHLLRNERRVVRSQVISSLAVPTAVLKSRAEKSAMLLLGCLEHVHRVLGSHVLLPEHRAADSASEILYLEVIEIHFQTIALDLIKS